MKRPQAGKSCATEGEKDESTSLVLKVAKLRKGWEFDEIFRTGERVNGELVRILYLRGREPDVKFGCVVGKRQGKAHVRSRGKRILREAFRALSEKVADGLSIVLALQDKGLSSKSTEIQKELERLMARKKLLVK